MKNFCKWYIWKVFNTSDLMGKLCIYYNIKVVPHLIRLLKPCEQRIKYEESRHTWHVMNKGIWAVDSLCISLFYFILFYVLKILFILFLAALGLCCCTRAFSSCSERGYFSLQCAGVSLQWLLLLWSMGSRRAGFSSCGSRALEHRLSSCGAWA